VPRRGRTYPRHERKAQQSKFLEVEDNAAGIAESIRAELEAAFRVLGVWGDGSCTRLGGWFFDIEYRNLLSEVFHLHRPNPDVFLQLYINAASGDHGESVCRDRTYSYAPLIRVRLDRKVSSTKELVDGDAHPLKSSVSEAKPPGWTSQITLRMESHGLDIVCVTGKLNGRTEVFGEIVAS